MIVFNPPATYATTFYLRRLSQSVLYSCVSKWWYGCKWLGSLTWAQMLMHAIFARRGWTHTVRVSTKNWLGGKNPFLHQGVEPTSPNTQLSWLHPCPWANARFAVLVETSVSCSRAVTPSPKQNTDNAFITCLLREEKIMWIKPSIILAN